MVCAITTDRDVIKTTLGEKEGSQKFYFSHNIFEDSAQHENEIIKEEVWSCNFGLQGPGRVVNGGVTRM